MIAITGANGLLGSFIVRKLIAKNEKFVALKRRNSDTSILDDVQENIQWRNADILDPVSLEEAFDGVTSVIHAAAMVSFNPRSANLIYKINVEGTKHVVNCCLANGIKKLVHISSVAALGRQKGEKTIDENHKWTDNPLNSTYAKSKYLAELEVYRAHEEGLETVIVNPSVILAPADWTRSSAKLFKYVWDEKPFYVDSYINWVDVRDVAEATYQLLYAHCPGERFIVNADSIALIDFFSQTAQRFNKKIPSIRLSQPLIKILAILESFRTWINATEPLITRETARLAGSEFLYQNEKIRKRLNFTFQTVDQTLDWCCQYYMNRSNRKK